MPTHNKVAQADGQWLILTVKASQSCVHLLAKAKQPSLCVKFFRSA